MSMPVETLVTKRLRIVPLTREEFEEKRRETDFGEEEFSETMEELAERMRSDFPARFPWYTNRLIYRREDNVYLGSCAFMNSPERDTDRQGLVEIGYAIAEPYRNCGYMTEAVSALCACAQKQEKVYGLIAGVRDGNPASERVLQKNGFVLTDHSDTLSLQVWKRIFPDRRPLPFYKRIL